MILYLFLVRYTCLFIESVHTPTITSCPQRVLWPKCALYSPLRILPVFDMEDHSRSHFEQVAVTKRAAQCLPTRKGAMQRTYALPASGRLPSLARSSHEPLDRFGTDPVDNPLRRNLCRFSRGHGRSLLTQQQWPRRRRRPRTQ